MNCLPKLNMIRKVINQGLISRKELIPIKIVLDIYENYYKNHDSLLFEVKVFFN